MRPTPRTLVRTVRFVALVPALALAAQLALAGRAHADTTVWQTPDTLSGLVGSYSRASSSTGALVYVTLGGSDGYRAQGPYTRFVQLNGILTLQSGSYLAIGNNPAIGPIITFEDEQGEPRDSYFILGLRRDPLGRRITALKLLSEDGTPVVLYRVGL